jgi:hypothetical protein
VLTGSISRARCACRCVSRDIDDDRGASELPLAALYPPSPLARGTPRRLRARPMDDRQPA